jgi:hypothetical protein
LSRKGRAAEAGGLAERAEAEQVGPEAVEQAAVAELEAREAPAGRGALAALEEQEAKAAPAVREAREAPEELAEEPQGGPAAGSQ